jgi:hypothetical protein
MFVSALARYPTTAESERWKRLFGELRTATDPMLDELAWAQIAHTLFNTKEFIHYR